MLHRKIFKKHHLNNNCLSKLGYLLWCAIVFYLLKLNVSWLDLKTFLNLSGIFAADFFELSPFIWSLWDLLYATEGRRFLDDKNVRDDKKPSALFSGQGEEPELFRSIHRHKFAVQKQRDPRWSYEKQWGGRKTRKRAITESKTNHTVLQTKPCPSPATEWQRNGLTTDCRTEAKRTTIRKRVISAMPKLRMMTIAQSRPRLGLLSLGFAHDQRGWLRSKPGRGQPFRW